jgi:PAS domain S-box-containing protein
MPDGDFDECYAAALRHYLSDGGEASLAIGHDLGRRALRERLSMMEIVEGHFRVVEEAAADSGSGVHATALQFLLQALATFDIATRGFLDGTKRYQQQRARADDLEDRDAFRSALVNSLQEGFFVVDHEGTIIEVNEAFAAITGCGLEGLPYRWPYPWLADQTEAGHQLARLAREGSLEFEAPITHRDGRMSWAAVSINSVTEEGDDRGAYVGTVRDVTTERSAEVRRRAVVRLATALGVATSVAEVLDILLAVVAASIEVQRVVAVMWTQADSDPSVRVAGTPGVAAWRDLDPRLRSSFSGARDWPPLAVEAVATPDGSGRAGGMSGGMMTVLSGADAVLWFEYPEPRATSDEDRILVAGLIGHLSLAVQHVRQFEIAREASLTLQRTMMPTTKPPVGFAVRYEPAVSPLEIGGDWYDVLAIGDHQIGVVVGDCVGSGLSAAAVMGQLRSSARVLLINGTAPARLLDELDSAAALIPGAYCTTVFVCTIDTDTGEMTYSSAGHIPALLAVTGVLPETLTGATSVPLAVQKTGPRPEASKSLPPGSTLMLYTDGLVERRDGMIDNGIQRAGRVLSDMIEFPAEAVADVVLSQLAPTEGFDDDVAIVVYRRPPAPLQLEVPATPDQLSDIRGQLGSWLRATGIPDDLAGDIVLVVNEACTNSIEHGYRARAPGRMLVDVEAKLPDANPRSRGRGVPLMRAVSGDVNLDGTSTGTTVTMNFELV